jgi:excinuclease ABC subunit C
MNEIISNKLKSLPTTPGVYEMKDNLGKIIYVGKAINLKRRVSSYFKGKRNKQIKVLTMVENIADFDYILTKSNADAFALENNLIKKYMPFYNILLKDSKTYPYIKIDMKCDFPRLEIARKVKDDGAKYFGPYTIGINASTIIGVANRAFSLRTCGYNFSVNKPLNRECINYSMGLCPAPCVNKISKEDYSRKIDSAIDFLNGDNENIEKIIRSKMQENVEKQNFEEAIKQREELKVVDKLKEKVFTELTNMFNADIFAYYSDGILSAVAMGVVRNGKMLGVNTSSVNDLAKDESDILEEYIVSYYKMGNLLPKTILLDNELNNITDLKEFLEREYHIEVDFVIPQKGDKKRIVDMVKANARQHLVKSLAVNKVNYNRTIGAEKQLQELLNLKNEPKRMECYDISHISGTYKVGSMVVFINGEPNKKHYRKFKIKTVEGNNDFASLKEVLTRRLKELNNDESNDESFKSVPNLIVIDGGKGQLSSVMEVFNEYAGIYKDKIEVVSLAKKLEEVYEPNNHEPYRLSYESQALKLLQRIRDEAHRFAITFHRETRTKNMTKDDLDKIKGVGKVKKQNLINAFKTIDNIKRASLNELCTVKGIYPILAKTILDELNKTK